MTQLIETYEEACQLIAQWGILPLSSFVPDHPSLEALTRSEAWYTSRENDPWMWRNRLPESGVAAYGRFLAGKPLFVDRELFLYVRGALRPARDLKARYTDGLVSRATVALFEVISELPGIDARKLRGAAGLQNRADKRDFDQGLIELQEGGEILISGLAERLNAQGTRSAWNSACYMLSDHWISFHAPANQDLTVLNLPRAEARKQLFARLEPRLSAGALKYIQKKIPL